MIPKTFEEGKYCIEVKCKISLSKEFVLRRLAVYEDEQNPETQKFITCYGRTHLSRVINWLQQANLNFKSHEN